MRQVKAVVHKPKPMYITTDPHMQYRVIYDNLSGFSVELNKANSLNDVQLILQNNIHRLFNCCTCRITYFQQNNFVCYTITSETPAVVTGTHQLLWDIEKLLLYEGLPLRLNAVEHSSILQHLPVKTPVDKLWGWKLNYSDDAGILFTVLTEENNPFSRKHIPLVKMVSEMLFTKIRLLLLLQTMQKNEAEFWKSAQEEAIDTNENEQENTQDSKFEERRQELKRLNRQLVDIIQFNSHTIREPLTRIMGLMQLKSLVSEDEFFNSCWPMMVASVHDLDKRLRELIQKTEKI